MPRIKFLSRAASAYASRVCADLFPANRAVRSQMDVIVVGESHDGSILSRNAACGNPGAFKRPGPYFPEEAVPVKDRT